MADLSSANSISSHELPAWILSHIPALTDRYDEAVAESEPRSRKKRGFPSPYFIFSYVVKPHILDLLAAGTRYHSEVQRIFGLLEHLATTGDEQVRSCLNVAMEEVDVSVVAEYLGPTMTEWEFERVSWFPHGSGVNAHVDPQRYRSRWKEEIDRIGGLVNLSVPQQLSIRYRLVREFGITGMRTPEPQD